MARSPSRPDQTPDDGEGPAGVVRDDAALVRISAAPDTISVGNLGEAAAALGQAVIPVPAGGPGVGADRIAQPTAGVEARALDPRTADPRGPVAGEARQGQHYGPAGAGWTYGGPDPQLVIDPDGVPGTHRLQALTNIRRDGRGYAAGEEIELDYRGYEELVAIGAVQPIDWRTGKPLHLGPGLRPS